MTWIKNLSYIYLFQALLEHSERKKQVALYFVVHTISIVFVLLQPLIILKIFDEIQQNSLTNLQVIYGYLLQYVSLFFGFNIFHRIGRFVERQVAFHAEKNVSLYYFEKYICSYPALSGEHSANVSNRIKTAAEALNAFGERQFQYIEYLLKFIGPIFVLTLIDPVLAALALALSLSTVSIIAYFDTKLTKLFEQKNDIYHSYVATLTEYSARSQSIYQSNSLHHFLKRLQLRFDLGLVVLKKVILVNQSKWFLVSLGILLTEIGVLALHLQNTHTIGAAISIGTVAAILQYMQQLTSTFFNIAGSYYNIIQWKVKFDSIQFLEKNLSYLDSRDDLDFSKQNWGEIHISKLETLMESGFNACFSDLRIKKGEKICILGPSGSGKSTFLEILSGVRAPEVSEIYIDGEITDLLSCKIFKLARQSPDIFDDTLAFNITMEDECDLPKLEHVISDAVLAEIVRDKGLSVNLSEAGNLLSVGQKQRVGLARVLYSIKDEHDVILLDEPTSALEENTSNELVRNILASYKDNTIICSTHDQSLIPLFDRVVYFESGSFVK